ncbi:TPA: aryl-sulfate sulfotransferase [Enterobacter cloacae]
MEYEIIVNPYGQNMLSALLKTDISTAVRYNYTVFGKTANADFSYSNEEYCVSPEIIIVGLYADYINNVKLTVTTETGESETISLTIDTSEMDYGNVPLKLTVNIFDEVMAKNTLGSGWFVTSSWNGYDINGDLRITGLFPWMYGNLKIIDGSLWSARASETYDPDKHAFAPNLYRINLAGKISQTLVAPEGYGFHHDITTDNKGNLFILGSILDNWDDEHKLESIIFKYDLASGTLLWQRDYSKEFAGATVLDNTDTNDVHFNSLEYVPETNQLIVNSRSSCTILGLNIESGDPEWIIDNPAFPVLDSKINLKVINEEQFKYTNGEHAVFLTANKKYEAFRGDNKFVISMFNNNSCADAQGNELVRIIESEPVTYASAALDSLPTVFAVDLNEFSVQRLDQFSFEGQRSELTSSVFDTGNDYYNVYFGAEQSFFVFDTENNTGVSIYNIDTGLGYRGRIFSHEELCSLI